MQQELLAVKWGLKQFRSSILGRSVKVVTDHANLKWLTAMASQQAKVDFFIEHRKGERNAVPDVPVKENIPEDNIVIPPQNSGIVFMIIATSVDVPHHTPELIHGTFNNTQRMSYTSS